MLNEAQKREQAERERQERLLRAQQEAEEQRRLEQEAKERVQQMYEEEMRHREQVSCIYFPLSCTNCSQKQPIATTAGTCRTSETRA